MIDDANFLLIVRGSHTAEVYLRMWSNNEIVAQHGINEQQLQFRFLHWVEVVLLEDLSVAVRSRCNGYKLVSC